MANAFYPLFKQAALRGLIDLTTDTLAVALIDTADYTYSAAHEFLDDVPGAAIVSDVDLTSVTTTNGVIDAADTAFPSVTGDTAEALIYYINTGSAATSRLVLYVDTGAGGLPVTPNGEDITLTFDAQGIAAL